MFFRLSKTVDNKITIVKSVRYKTFAWAEKEMQKWIDLDHLFGESKSCEYKVVRVNK